MDLFASRFNHNIPRFISPVPNWLAWKVDLLTLQWENLDTYAFPLVAILGQVVSKHVGPQMSQIILIAPGWPNMTWFWDRQHVSSNSPLTFQIGEFAHSTVQSVPAQRSPQPKSACLAPRATAIQEAGFSDKVATRI